MKRRLFCVKTALLALLGLAPMGAAAQDDNTVDLEVWYMHSFSSSPQQNQHPKLRINNNGTVAIEGFQAEVFKEGESQFTEQVTLDQPLPAGEWTDVTLQGTVQLPFDATTSVSVTLTLEGDVNPDNNSASTTITMPGVLDYPYVWNVETCQQDFTAGSSWWFGGWQWDSQNEAWYEYGKGTNWMYNIYSKIINIPEDEKVNVAFEYVVSAPVTMTVYVDYGFATDTLKAELTADGGDEFQQAFVSFEAKGPAIITFSPRLDDIMSYGGIYVRNINVKPAVRDLAAKQFLSPATSQLAVSSEPQKVSVRFRNQSPFDIESPVFAYQLADGDVVRETYDGIIGNNGTLDYTFQTPYTVTEPATLVLKAWCEVARDGDASNDTIQKSVIFYEAEAFPYHSTFDEGNDLWSASGFGFNYLSSGDAVAYGSAGQLVSPAISLPAGTARVSFYYASVNRSGANLKLYMGRSPSDLSEVLFDKNIVNGGWLNGYHLLNIEEAGNYYFIFQYDGANDQLVLDNFKVDAEEDLCMHSVEFDVESGFNLTEAKVTLGLVNHGVTAQKDIDVRYFINDLDHFVTETITAAVAPGDTLFYTFQQPVDVSATDSTYTVYGQIVTEVGEDKQNDLIQGQTIQNFAPYAAPYYYDFTDPTQNGQWQLPKAENGTGWNVEDNYYAYDGSQDLKHTNYEYQSTTQADNWAYSPAIVLQPGDYEVSFFHRGRTYFGGEEYQQSFEARLGTERTPQGMTIALSSHENLDYAGAMNFKKDVARVTITEAGEYYLGFHNTSAANDGETHIDGVSIVPVESGKALPFVSDFANGDDGWTKYNENSSDYFVKWQLADGAEEAVMDGGGYVEGPLVSPKLAVEPGKEVVVTVEYDLTTDSEELAANLYTAGVNSPQALQQQATGTPSEHTLTATVAPEGNDFYVAVRTNSDMAERDYLYSSFTLRIKSVKVEYAVTDGISDLGIQPAAAASQRLFDLQGRSISRSADGTQRQLKGIYIDNGRKLLVK